MERGRDGRGGLGSVGEILKVDEESGEGLADLIVELAGDGAALLFLSVDQTLGQFLEFVLGANGLLEFFAGVPLEAGEIKDGGGSEEEPEGESREGNQANAVPGLREDAGDLGFGLAKIEFIEVTDLAGEAEDGSALGKGEVAQRDIVFFGGVDDEDTVREKPVGGKLVAKLLESGVLIARERAEAGVEGRVGVIAEVVELFEIGLAGRRVGPSQGIFAEEIAGFVEAEADFAESAFAVEIVLADGGAGAFEFVEGVDRIEGQDGHKDEKGTKAENHGGARADTACGAGGGRREGLRVRMGRKVHASV